MKAEELRKLTAPELETKLGELKKELFNLRFQHQIDEVKHDIARVMTVLNEKNA